MNYTAICTPYWGISNIPLTFCEGKYEKNKYIAEYYNTLSSIGYLFLGLYLIKNKQIYLGYCLIYLFVGTFIMHMTLQRYGQIMDETAMLLIVFNVSKKLNVKNTQIQKYCLNTLTYTSFTVYIIFNKNKYIFISIFFSYLLYCGKLINKKLRGNTNLILYTFFMTISFVFWLLDQLCYNKVDYYHALWHIGTTISMFFGFLEI